MRRGTHPSATPTRAPWLRWSTLLVILVAALLLLPIQTAAATSLPPVRQAAAPATVTVADNADYGKILVGADGMTLYMFDKDTPDTSNCYDQCAEKWPPLLVAADAQPVAGDGVTAKLGVTERTDGTRQVTANGMPLYYWFKDTAAGDATGQAVGEIWWVLAPDGAVIHTPPPAAEAAPAATPAATEAATPAATEVAAAAAPATVTVADNADYGKILVGADGMTLYMFDKDTPDTSNCYDQCAEKWPPLLVAADAQPVAGDGVTAKLGVTERTDGTRQVTANGMPLYYWFKDTAAGDATGQAVGEIWWVLAPDGAVIHTPPPAAEAAPAAAPAATEAATPAAAEAAPATAEVAAAPAQLPVTGGDGGVATLAITGLTLLAGGGWLALRRMAKR